MNKKAKPPLRPINEWVRRALDHTEKSDAAVARELHARGLIGTADRSVPGKMATDRDVKAAEMLALSEITGYPPMKGDVSLDDRKAVLALLASIRDLPSAARESVYSFMLGVSKRTDVSPQSDQPHDRSEPASPHRELEPSGSKSRPPSS